MIKTCFKHSLAIVAALCGIEPAVAQEYPAKLIRIVVPFAPGASTDILARAVAQRYTEAWGQPVIVDNRAGAGGTTGTAFVAKSPPDGYTLLMATATTHTVTPHTFKNVPYDALRDFAPVSLVAWVPSLMTVHPSLPVRDVKGFIALARARPGQLLFASSGTGTNLHLAGELFKQMAKIDVVHIPYKGGGPALIDTVSGQVHFTFNTVAAALAYINAQRLRPLGMTTLKRSALFPELPTISESGLPGYEIANWVGVVAPAATPAAIVTKLNAEVARWIALPETQKKMVALGVEADGRAPATFGEAIEKGYRSMGKVVQVAGVKPE